MLHAVLAAVAFVQPPPPPADKPPPAPPVPGPTMTAAPTSAAIKGDEIDAAIATGVALLLKLQEGDPNTSAKAEPSSIAEWPYEGVYRVGGKIPIGYRIGGSAIVCSALLAAPGYEGDDARKTAVARSIKFICDGTDHPLMSVKDYSAGYDVRGWGYTYGAQFLLELKNAKQVPEGHTEAVDTALTFYLQAIEQTQMPGTGGWNYARPAGKDTPGAPSSFMTASTVQALLLAKSSGYAVNEETLTKALNFLEKSRYGTGSVAYSGEAGNRASGDGVPGAVGRMCIVEATLRMAGRGSVKDVRGAVDAFLVHWDWLEVRRQKTGTHVAPYGVAPYYFMFAHRYAAQAIELLPKAERDEYRRRYRLTLWRSREADGSWNDRVFRRSAGYGTAMAMLSLMEGRK